MNSWKNFGAVVAMLVTGYFSPAFSQDSDAGITSIESALHDRKHQSINFDYIYGNSGKRMR